jgi:hypothetical protein
MLFNDFAVSFSATWLLSLPLIADQETFSFLKWAAPASDLRRPQNLG